MSIPISGILLDPYGNVARFADIKFVTVQGALDVIESSSAVFRTDENGAYSIDVQFGRFAVLMRFNGNNGAYEKIQTISVNSDTVASTLGELLEYTEPLTPGEILIVQQLAQQAADAKDDAEAAALAALLSEQNAAASAAAALASETAAANSVALLAPVPLNGGVWAAGQTFTAYNQYMIFNGEAYSPRQETVLPYVVGATPDLNFVYQIKLNSLQALSGLTEPSDLDKNHRTAATLAKLASGDYGVGSKLIFSELADAKFDVVTGGAPNGIDILDAGNGNTAVYQYKNTVNVNHLGAVAGVDMHAILQRVNAMCAANSFIRYIEFNKLDSAYVVNDPLAAVAWRYPSDVVVNGNGCQVTTTNTTPVGFRSVDGANDSHVKGFLFTGWANDCEIQDGTNCSISHCIGFEPTNKSFVVRGPLCDNNIVKHCLSYRPRFHGFNCDQRSDFAPSGIDRDDRNYPLRTLFENCITFGESAQIGTAFDAHSNGAAGGLTTLRDCGCEDTTLFFKSQHGPLLVDGGYWKKGATANPTLTTGAGYLMLIGSWRNSDGGSTILKNMVIDTAVDDALFIVEGDAAVIDCKIRLTGVNNRIGLGKLNIGDLRTFDFLRNKVSSPLGDHLGFNASSTGLFFGEDGVAPTYERLCFEDNKFEVPMALNATGDALFKFSDGFQADRLSIKRNKFVMDPGSFNGAGLVSFGGLTASGSPNFDLAEIEDNEVVNSNLYVKALADATCRHMRVQNNKNIALDRRLPGVYYRLDVAGNLPRDIINTETSPTTTGTAVTLISNVNPGEFFEVTFATDRNNGGSAFHGFQKFYVALSRDGTALSYGEIASFNPLNVGAVLQLNGSNIDYYATNSARIYITVKRIGRYH